MAGFFLGFAGCPAHSAAHGHDHSQENGDHQCHHNSQLPLDRTHDHQSANDRQHRSQQILRAVVGKLCQFKKVRGKAAHQLTGTVAVIEIKAHGLHVCKQILADIRFHPDTKGMAIVGHNIIEDRAQHIAGNHHCHNDEEGSIELSGQQFIERMAGDQRECQVNGRDQARAQHIDGKELLMVFKIA